MHSSERDLILHSLRTYLNLGLEAWINSRNKICDTRFAHWFKFCLSSSCRFVCTKSFFFQRYSVRQFETDSNIYDIVSLCSLNGFIQNLTSLSENLETNETLKLVKEVYKYHCLYKSLRFVVLYVVALVFLILIILNHS